MSGDVGNGTPHHLIGSRRRDQAQYLIFSNLSLTLQRYYFLISYLFQPVSHSPKIFFFDILSLSTYSSFSFLINSFMLESSEAFMMSEKLCLQWNDFKENVTASFRSLRHDEDFADVTLACEDGKQVEAHRVILASSSPVFQKIFKRNKHAHL